jgi:hypothetical protein
MLTYSSRNIIGDPDVESTFTILENVNAINCRHQRDWLRGLDLNQRPSGYEPDELPGCSTPRLEYVNRDGEIKFKLLLAESTGGLIS